ncbi:MAG TPA: pirin family protein [Polyangiaceae bacterium]|jgi:hypothetical protein|nr:pirin family protein [Polyangiaceae bacterium]
MQIIRRSAERGLADHGWLHSRHTFSFADYYDSEHMGFRALRVINEDRVQPGRGFGAHPHRDMEIISYVLDGSLQHKDSMKNGSTIRPGDVQRMSAGTGVVHSEFNGSQSEDVHFLQIWLLPNKRGMQPSYEQKSFDSQLNGNLVPVATPDARAGSVLIHADASVYAGRPTDGQTLEIPLAHGYGWLQVARGRVLVGDTTLEAGDGLAVSDEPSLKVQAVSLAEILVFDLG